MDREGWGELGGGEGGMGRGELGGGEGGIGRGELGVGEGGMRVRVITNLLWGYMVSMSQSSREG